MRDYNNYLRILLLSVPDLSMILLEKKKKAVDSKLRDQQAGLEATDQVASLRIIIKQSLE